MQELQQETEFSTHCRTYLIVGQQRQNLQDSSQTVVSYSAKDIDPKQ